MKHGKKIIAVRKNVDRQKYYSLEDALALVIANSKKAERKFDESLEIAMNLGIDTKHSDQAVRGMVQLPNGTGKTVRVAVFAKGDKADAAKAAGADFVGADDLYEQIMAGKSDFDRVIATPDMMGIVGKLGKVLGPRGLMPNPKLGTVTPNVADAVKGAKGGSIEYRAEKGGIVQAGIGKISFKEKALLENAHAFIDAVIKAKPSASKGNYLNRITLSSTMGAGVKVDLATIAKQA